MGRKGPHTPRKPHPLPTVRGYIYAIPYEGDLDEGTLRALIVRVYYGRRLG